jgi:hypothetical protein
MTQRLINLRTIHGFSQVSACCVGEMAAHGQITEGGVSADKFSVTHLPSGICFSREFPSLEAAFSAADEINALRDDWATFDLKSFVPTNEFKAALQAIYSRHGGIFLPPADGDRRMKLARQNYTGDLNGYREVHD